MPSRTAIFDRIARATAPLHVALLLALLVIVLAQPLIEAPSHPPDVHSRLPHRAPIVAAAEVALTDAATALLPGAESRSGLAVDAGQRPGSVEAEPPDHPPR